MSFLRRFFERRYAESRFYPVRVRCARCGELLETRIDLHNDLSAEYDDRGRVQAYYVRKVLHGTGRNRCFAAVEVELTFDSRKNVLTRRIHGGAFVDEVA